MVARWHDIASVTKVPTGQAHARFAPEIVVDVRSRAEQMTVALGGERDLAWTERLPADRGRAVCASGFGGPARHGFVDHSAVRSLLALRRPLDADGRPMRLREPPRPGVTRISTLVERFTPFGYDKRFACLPRSTAPLKGAPTAGGAEQAAQGLPQTASA